MAIVAISLALSVLCTILGVMTVRLVDKRRSATLANQAKRLGFLFQANSAPFICSRVEGLTLLAEGPFTEVANVMWGDVDGRSILVFDVRCCCETVSIVTTAAAVRCSLGELPVCQIEPQNALARLEQLAASRDVRFNHDRNFSTRFCVYSNDEASTRALLNQTKRRELLRYAGEFRIECSPDWILAYTPGKKLKPDSIQRLVSAANNLAATLTPRYSQGRTGTDD